MRRDHHKTEPRPERTIFRLTRDEVIEALAQAVASNGELVPDGSRFVWVRSSADSEDDWLASLVVDHVALEE